MSPLDWTPEAFPGTSLRESDITERRRLSERWDPVARYAWDTGIATTRYLTGLKNGQIMGVRCRTCDRVVVPPRTVCERCFRPINEYVPVRDTGTVNTFSISHVAWNAAPLSTPEIPAVVDLDGASPGVGIMHKLGEVDPADIHTGLRVQAVWKPARQRTGAITDIRYFKPLTEEPDGDASPAVEVGGKPPRSSWQGEVPIYSVYTLGVAGDRFFRELKETGRVLGTRCTRCNLLYAPPRLYCERCLADLSDAWEETPNRGRVHSLTLAHYGLDGERLDPPQPFALVRMDGAHGVMLHRLGEAGPGEVQVGSRVEMVLKSPSLRKGSITDIRYFRPLRGRGRRRR